MGRMFGTDGVRGIANKELTCELAMQIGKAGAYVLTGKEHAPTILVGQDSRRSGPMLAAALSAGICSVGGTVLDVGILPTPAMAYLVRLYGADAAVMISASHNPMEYNGIKWFDGKGFKLSDATEDRIEAIIKGDEELPIAEGSDIGTIKSAEKAREDYIDYIVSRSRNRFDGKKIALDSANGASSFVAKRVFEKLGAEVIAFACTPDGTNINARCGSTHPENLQALVKEIGADAGFAFDGDADRLISVDRHGCIVDGDKAMGIMAMSLHKKGLLKKDTLVVTVMSNLGLKKAMQRAGIHIAETKVGDRYVLEEMLKEGYSIGGEQSGHIILLEHNTTGDGVMSAVQLMNVLIDEGKPLDELASAIPQFPQVLVNVTVANDEKSAAMNDKEFLAKSHEIENEMNGDGRVLLRASGTEPLIRVMLEGCDEKEILEDAMLLARIVEKNHNGKIRS